MNSETQQKPIRSRGPYSHTTSCSAYLCPHFSFHFGRSQTKRPLSRKTRPCHSSTRSAAAKGNLLLTPLEKVESRLELQKKMDDWEDQPAPPVLKKELLQSSWDDEDAEDNEVKDSWEDEDESAPPLPVAAPVPKPAKVSKKADVKDSGKQLKSSVAVKEEPLDPVAEKLRQQRLVEESDYKFTTELFGKKDDDKSLDNFIPKSESDFMEYAELVSHKLRPYEKSFHYLGLLKAVMRLSMKNLKAADAKEVASSVTAIANEKLKAEKEANAGKKKTAAKKKQLQVDKPDDEAVDVYDALDDDFDFM
ncbi:unnamed protein product [Rhodiola kirilowii]